LKKLHFISVGLAVFALIAANCSVLGWPFKHESNNSSPQVYPLGPDADGLFTTRTGLKFKDITKGEGKRPLSGQTVAVHYTGWLTNGTKFDSSVDRGQPFEFVLDRGNVIKGWDEGVKSMRIGGKRHLIIPPQLGYGTKGQGESIPPNATLVFDVELLGIK
jgi:FKBP-type peptidyl-prolyl cis-trans isomerase